MQPTIRKLLTTLDEEAACYRNMKTLLADEEKAISLSEKDRFDRVQMKKDMLVGLLQRHEETRNGLVAQLTDTFAAGGKTMTVRQLAQFVDSPHDQELLSRADRLRSIISDVQEKNSRNRLLINQYLGLIKGSLKLLINLIEDTSVYQKPGTRQPAAGYQSGGGRVIRGTV
jgi:flagellar biosynthesis/type III secretory pathway chaperone